MKITHSIYGGLKKDQPASFKRVFDDRRKRRKVRATILKFYGVGIHYYPTLTEEGNPAIIQEEGVWKKQVCWDDPEEIKGRTESGPRCNTREEALSWIDKTFSKKFGPRTHRLQYGDLSTVTRKAMLEGD